MSSLNRNMFKFKQPSFGWLILSKRFMSGRRRKYPVDPEAAKQLPVFKYSVSKKEYRRVFVWGNLETGALGVPFLKAEENRLECRKFPKRLGFGEKYEVTTAACGFGFTAFAVNSDTDIKIYGTGINTDSQIGYHAVRKDKPLEVIFYPRPIHLPFKHPSQSKVLKLSAGRAHLLILTDEGLFSLGNNAYGQCGRRIIPDESYIMSNFVHHTKQIDGKRIVDVECGQDHSLALTDDGSVYSCGWGADGQTGLGHYDNASEFARVKGDVESENIVKLSSRSDFVLALNDKGKVFGWGNIEYGQMPLPGDTQQVCYSKHIQMLDGVGPITSIASAGSFCLVSNADGQVFSWGFGLLGAGPEAKMSKRPVHLPETLFGKNDFQPNARVTEVVCGLFHAGAITNFGDVYIWGKNKSGSLGLGSEKDQYFPLKVCIGGVVSKVFCGIDHTVAICKPFV